MHVSPIFRADDPNTVKALVHLLHKMHNVPQEQAPLPLVSRNRQYPMVQAEGWLWRPFNPDSLSYRPHSSVVKFFLLQNYHGGGDGHVWLAASEAGRLAVLKFPKRTAESTADSLAEQLAAECTVWKGWTEAARVLQLGDRQALVMPFAFRARFDIAAAMTAHPPLAPEGFITFQGPNAWVMDGSGGRPVDNIAEDDQVCKAVCDFVYVHSAVGIAREAITRFMAQGLVHGDLCWRHVALLPKKMKHGWQVESILIDLTRVQAAEAADLALAEMWFATSAQQRQPIPAVETQIAQLQAELLEKQSYAV